MVQSTNFEPNFKCLSRLTDLNRTTQVYKLDTEISILQNQSINSSEVDKSVNTINFNGMLPGHTRVEEEPVPPEPTSGSWISVQGKI